MKKNEVTIKSKDLIDLIHWARRYCDNRSTFAPSSFNNIYIRLRSDNPDLFRCKDEFDKTLKDNGAYWPYAQDGNYNSETGVFDARL